MLQVHVYTSLWYVVVANPGSRRYSDGNVVLTFSYELCPFLRNTYSKIQKVTIFLVFKFFEY